ncbi:molybdate ABC transporter permease subunit [Hippea alviniae]|uniref:molybdate ABC transporter permease subunit n=1 Tax=Hippea alviniae TaxID=1279027 RepID=UPI0003B43842|nr:ABC transporter permease subunit [Hippea alviniae]
MRLTQISFVFTIILTLFLVSIIAYGFIKVNPKDIVALFGDGEFLSAVWFGLKTSSMATMLSAVFGIPSGFFLARSNSMFSRILDSFFDIPLIIPPLIVGTLLLTLFNAPFIKSFYSFIFTTAGATIAQFFVAFPFSVKASKNAFELIPPTYERIAMTLGASNFSSFYDTTFKLAFSSIMSGLMLTWLRSLGEFGATLMVGGGIAYKTANIPINIYLKMTEGNFNEGLAASILIVVVSFVAVIVIKSLFRRRWFID